MTQQPCPPELIAEVVEATKEGDTSGLNRVEALLKHYDSDGRLHFLRGSLLASLKRYPEACAAMRAAVKVQPDLAIARFQLGFLSLTSGDAAGAEAAWAPLAVLANDNALKLFAQGLKALARDEFETAIAFLQQGILRNTEIAPLNNDMQLMINEIRRKQAGQSAEDEPSSSAQMLLQQLGRKPTQH